MRPNGRQPSLEVPELWSRLATLAAPFRGFGGLKRDVSDEPTRFREVDAETFEAARSTAARAVSERTPPTEAELAAGWREDPVSGLRRNVVTREWDAPASFMWRRSGRHELTAREGAAQAAASQACVCLV